MSPRGGPPRPAPVVCLLSGLACALGALLAEAASAPERVTRPAPGPPGAPEVPAVAPAPAPVVRPLREIAVKLACDDEFCRRPAWREEAVARLARASRRYEREFRIRFVPRETVDWVSDDTAADLSTVAQGLDRSVQADECDVVVALTGQLKAHGSKDTYHVHGLGTESGRRALATTRPLGESDAWDDSVLVHELGHVLGAWHCADERSVMHDPAGDADVFDEATRFAIQMARRMDFHRGVESLGWEAIDALVDSYVRSHQPGEPLSLPDAVGLAAWHRAHTNHDLAGALELRERALAMRERVPGNASEDLVDALASAADAANDDAEFGRAAEFAARELRLVASKHHDVSAEVPGLERTGYALIGCGRTDEARAAYARIESIRRAEVPLDAEKVKSAAANVAWFDTLRPPAEPGDPGPPGKPAWTELSVARLQPGSEVLDCTRPRDGPRPGEMYLMHGVPPGGRAQRAAMGEIVETLAVSVARAGTMSLVMTPANEAQARGRQASCGA